MAAIKEEDSHVQNGDKVEMVSLTDSTSLKIALSIYHKIDTVRVGYINLSMLRAYCERIL